MKIACTWVAAVAILLGATVASAQSADSTCAAVVAHLPLIERPATSDTNNTLVLLLTGDGGFAPADEKVAEGLRARGAAVLGVNMRTYLGHRRTPDETANDIGCAARAYLDRWHRTRLMVLGYSRGADLAPFIVSRWPADLRDRINMVALVSLSPNSNFQFHLIDLIRDVHRPDDLPVAPEIEKLRGMRVVCIYGTEEEDSGCREADSTVVTRYARPGGHRLTGGFDAVAEILSAGLYSR
jgi:type IV secretory pathway VirJ component